MVVSNRNFLSKGLFFQVRTVSFRDGSRFAWFFNLSQNCPFFAEVLHRWCNALYFFRLSDRLHACLAWELRGDTLSKSVGRPPPGKWLPNLLIFLHPCKLFAADNWKGAPDWMGKFQASKSSSSKFHNFEDLLRSLVNIKPSLTTLALAFHDPEAKNGTPVGGKRMLPGQFRWFEVSLFHHPRVPLLTAASTFLYQHIGLSLPNISLGHTPEFEVIFCSTSISMDIYHCLGLSVVIS